MVGLDKYHSLCIVVILAVSSLLIVTSTFAQTIPKPSVPEFVLKVDDDNIRLYTEIQNQPVVPNGHDTAGIFYDRRVKWHESANWYHYEPDPTIWKRQYLAQIGTTGVTRTINSPNSYYEILGSTTSHQLDVQYRAINGYLNTTVPVAPPIGIEPGDCPVIVVNTSEWSDTVTITLPDYKPEASTTIPRPTVTVLPSTEPTEPYTSGTQTTSPIASNDFVAVVTIALSVISAVLIILVLFVVVIYRRLQRGNQLTH